MSVTYVLPLLALPALGSTEMSAQQEMRLLRFPAIHGNQVVFTYAGNLYTVSSSGGVDEQLNKAIEVIKEELKKHPVNLPPPPPYPDKSR